MPSYPSGKAGKSGVRCTEGISELIADDGSLVAISMLKCTNVRGLPRILMSIGRMRAASQDSADRQSTDGDKGVDSNHRGGCWQFHCIDDLHLANEILQVLSRHSF